MKKSRVERLMKIMVPGVVLLQMTGCELTPINDFLQTIFLAVTAAGSVAILQNI